MFFFIDFDPSFMSYYGYGSCRWGTCLDPQWLVNVRRSHDNRDICSSLYRGLASQEVAQGVANPVFGASRQIFLDCTDTKIVSESKGNYSTQMNRAIKNTDI